MLITFSGLDGAGKSTLIEDVRRMCETEGRKVTVLTMYDHVGLYAIIRFVRDRMIGRVFRQTIKEIKETNDPDRLGLPQAKRSPLMRCIYSIVRSRTTRHLLNLFDVLFFYVYRGYVEGLKNHVFIMDRYFYDWLADTAGGEQWTYSRLLLWLAPTPTVSIFVDVPPATAFARKGEYSIAYNERRRGLYLKIFGFVKGAAIIENTDYARTKECLEGMVRKRLLLGVSRESAA